MQGTNGKVGIVGGMKIGITEDGIKGEQKLFKWLKDKKRTFFQPDAISFEDGGWIINECKNQEHFKAPPFDGHGLPPSQVEMRIWFWELTNIRCRFIIFEKGTNDIYWQWLDVLEKGEYFDTTTNVRRIYPLTAFNKE